MITAAFNQRAARAIEKGQFIRALVLSGFDVFLTSDRLLGVRNNRGMFEGSWETAKEAWYDITKQA